MEVRRAVQLLFLIVVGVLFVAIVSIIFIATSDRPVDNTFAIGMLWTFVGLVVFVIASTIGFIVLVLHLKNRRARILASVAASLGLSYQQKAGVDFAPYVGRTVAMPLRGKGRVRDVIEGTYRGLAVKLFLYHHEEVRLLGGLDALQRSRSGAGNTPRFLERTVAWVQTPASFPQLSVVPTTLDHQLMDALGGDDVDFESEEFSQRFWVKSKDRKFAYDVIHPRMIEFLLDSPWQRWELVGPLIIAWKPSGEYRPEEIRPMLDALVEFHALLPSYRKDGNAAAINV